MGILGLALEGIRVLDFSRFLSGPYCTKVLADMGADVIKIERVPDGDDSRRLSPKVNGESYPFAVANANKRSIAIDLKSEEGLEVVLRLARDADIVVENFRPGVMKRLAVGYEALRAINPRIIYCSITGFGQTGPQATRAGFDIIAQGVTGFMRMTGAPGEDRPTKMGIAVSDLAAGNVAVHSILYSLIQRAQNSRGNYIDISLVDAAIAWSIWEAGAYFGNGEVPKPTGSRHRRSAPYQAFRTADGYVTVGANNDRLWRRFCEHVVEKPEWLDDSRFSRMSSRLANIAALEAEIEEIFVTRDTDHWVKVLDDAGVPGGPVLTYDEALDSALVDARQMVVEMDHPAIGRMKVLGIPAKLSESPMSIRRAAPCLGQHTAEVLLDAGLSKNELSQLVASKVVMSGGHKG